jgi:hypothetical protein
LDDNTFVMPENDRVLTWLQRMKNATRTPARDFSDRPLQLSRIGSSEDLAAEIAATKLHLVSRTDAQPIALFPSLAEASERTELQTDAHGRSPWNHAGGSREMISPAEHEASARPLNEPVFPGNEVPMSEPAAAFSLSEFRAAEEQARQDYAQAQAMLEQTEASHNQSLLETEQAERRIAQLLSSAEQKRKDREAAERRLAEVALATEQGLKKLTEFENRLAEFNAAEEFAARSRAMAESRVSEIRDEIKRLTAELSQCEERSAKERLAEEHAATERAAAEQRLEKERIASQPIIEEHEQAQAFLQEDRDAEDAAIIAYNEQQEGLATLFAMLQQTEQEHQAAASAVMQAQAIYNRALRERSRAEKQAEEVAAAQARAEIEQQLAGLRAAEERAAAERASAERKLAELRAAQDRMAQERAALEQVDELPKPASNGRSSSTVMPTGAAPLVAPEGTEEELLEHYPPELAFYEESPVAQTALQEQPLEEQRTEQPEEDAAVSALSARKPSISTKIGANRPAPGRPPVAPPAPQASVSEEEPLAEEQPNDLAEALRRAAEEQRAAARELQTQPSGQPGSIFGVFGRKKAEPPPEATGETPLSISERIARDFGNLYDES